jgi:hypothetical protein
MNENEQLLSFTVDFTMGSVSAVVGILVDGVGTQHRLINMGRAGYDELMSANPTWAELKPANNFRKDDIEALINYMSET